MLLVGSQLAGLAHRAFVEQLYLVVLGRPGEAAGVQAHLQALRSGSSRAVVARGFLDSVERRRKLAAEAYQAFLGRAPTAAERDAAVQTQAAHGHAGLWIELLAGGDYFARNR